MEIYAQVGVAVGFISRDVLEARTVDEALERLTVAGQASGISINVGHVNDPHRQVNSALNLALLVLGLTAFWMDRGVHKFVKLC